MSDSILKKIILVGDTLGIAQLLPFILHTQIAALVSASLRPEYLKELMATAALLSVPVLVQPLSSSADFSPFLNKLEALQPDLILCHSYAMRVPHEILELVKHNAINMHWSLLPKNRGPNPIQWALIKGEKKTGLTLHYMTADFDRGDIVAHSEVAIDFEDTWVSLKEKLMMASQALLAQELPKILTGVATRRPQDEALATLNPRLTPESPRIDFDIMDDITVYNLVRAQVRPLRGAYVETTGGRVFFEKRLSLEEIKEWRKRFQ